MSLIAQSSIDEIRQRVSIVDLVGEQVVLRRQGSSFTGLCPFHSEKTPSFHVRETEGSFHCFGCGASGNLFGFVMRERGMTFPEAVEYLASKYNIELKREGPSRKRGLGLDQRRTYLKINQAAQIYFRKALQTPGTPVWRYLEKRGLDTTAVETFALGVNPRGVGTQSLVEHLRSLKFPDEFIVSSGLARRSQGGQLYDTLQGRLVFPIFVDSKQILGFGGRLVPGMSSEEWAKQAPKYLNSPETPVYQKSRVLYGLPHAAQAIRSANEAYVVEGYMDVIGMWQAGVQNVVAGCGTALTAFHLKRLSRFAPKAVLLFDGDEAGRAAAGKVLRLFLEAELDGEVLFLPAEHDPDTFVRAHPGRAAEALAALPRMSLLEAFLTVQAEKSGAASLSALGPAGFERVAREAVSTIASEKRTFARQRLLEEAAQLLRVDLKALGNLSQQLGEAPQRLRTEEPAGDAPVADAAAAGVPATPDVRKLGAVDRELLRCVMALKDETATFILSDAELCSALHPAVLHFVRRLQEICASEDPVEVKKARTRALLTEFGSSWVQQWRLAHEMLEDTSVDFRRTFEQCRRALRKERFAREMESLRTEAAAAREPGVELELRNRLLQLERIYKTA